MAKLSLTKANGALMPTSAADQETIQKLKAGAVIECEFKRTRNPAFHRKYFALLNLAFDYWEPKGGLIPDTEMRGIMGLAKHLAEIGGEPLLEAARDYVRKINRHRAENFSSVEKDFEAFRRWVTMEAGFFELRQSPAGIIKRPASISFASMEEDEFEGVYKAVFNTLWRFVLSSVFKDENDVHNAVEQLLGFA